MVHPRSRIRERRHTQLNYKFYAPLLPSLATSIFAAGCATLVGTVPPVEQRSTAYRFEAPSSVSADWAVLSQPVSPESSQSPDASDVAWQSSRTASIISLTSACRAGAPGTGEGAAAPSLEELTGQLLQGLVEAEPRLTKARTVSGTNALETTAQGRLSGETIRMKVLVTRVEGCTYDAMLVGRPDRFSTDEGAFERFLASLRWR